LAAVVINEFMAINNSSLEDPWPSEPDGTGQSLHRIVPADYGNDVANERLEGGFELPQNREKKTQNRDL
jgi:hypothetical protein